MSLRNDRPPFLGVKTGDLVLVQSSLNPDPTDTNWWIGWVIGNPDQFKDIHGVTMLSVVDTDTGDIRYVNAEQTTRLSLAGMEQSKVIPLVRS